MSWTFVTRTFCHGVFCQQEIWPLGRHLDIQSLGHSTTWTLGNEDLQQLTFGIRTVSYKDILPFGHLTIMTFAPSTFGPNDTFQAGTFGFCHLDIYPLDIKPQYICLNYPNVKIKTSP